MFSPFSRFRMPCAMGPLSSFKPLFGPVEPYHSRYLKSASLGNPQVPSLTAYQPTEKGFAEPQSKARKRSAERGIKSAQSRDKTCFPASHSSKNAPSMISQLPSSQALTRASEPA